ncbi:cytochrome P450 [Crossiella sp. NPDC003009]
MSAPERAPAVSLPLAQPSITEPPAEYARLQAECPVARVVTENGTQAWMVTRYEDVRFVLADPRFSIRFAGAASDNAEDAPEESLFQDPPGHSRLRRLVGRAFTARRMAELRPAVRRTAERLAAEMADDYPPAELVSDFAFPLSINVISELLGVPTPDRADFRAWSEAVISLTAHTPEQIGAAWNNLQGYVAELIEAKRRDPGSDLMSALIAVRDNEDDKLSTGELRTMAVTLLVAGHVSTVNAITMGMLTLLTNRAQYDRLVADPGLIEGAVEEILRCQFGKRGLMRIAKDDVQVGEALIRKGDTVFAELGAANVDASLFPEPARFDITRPENPHLAFGHGIHHCLGAALGRMELHVTLEVLSSAFPLMRTVLPVERIPLRTGLLDQSPAALLVTW